jgi:type IV pilus assembly protein PilW
MTTRAADRRAGFTLIELMIAILMGAIVVAGGVALLMSQRRTFQSSASDRALQDTARVALGEIGGSLRLAGYGVDPPLAFDFGPATNLTAPTAPILSGVSVGNTGYACAAPVTCRDRTDGPDEIVFYARDPFFGHSLTAVGGSASISISGPLNVELDQGQILQLMCTTGPMYWAYVTVGRHVAPDATGNPVTVPLQNGPGAELDFPFQNGVLVDPAAASCFTTGQVLVAKVDRFRYFIGTYDAAGVAQPPQTPGTRPFLMLDPGLVDQNNAAVLKVVAPDVEDLQLAYLYPRGLGLVGGTPGTVLAAGAAGVDLAPANGFPGYFTPITDPSRQNQAPSNIRAVKVSVVVRSATADFAIPDNVVLGAGNRPDSPGLPGYRRLRVETTVPVRNLDSRYPYYPFLSTNNGVDQNNVGGG